MMQIAKFSSVFACRTFDFVKYPGFLFSIIFFVVGRSNKFVFKVKIRWKNHYTLILSFLCRAFVIYAEFTDSISANNLFF